MKKTILTAVVLAGVISTYAQTNSNNESVNNAAANKNSIIIDGKKFPMTAAEYEAQRNVNVKQANMQKPVTNIARIGNPDQAGGSIKPNLIPVENNIQTKPDRTPNQVVPNSSTTTNKTVVVTPGVAVPSPATQTIPVGALKTSVASQVPVVAAAAKTTEVNNGAGTLVPMPTVSLASGAVDAQVVATPAVAATQQTMGQAKPAEIKEVPASVVNPAVKVPQVPMQSEEKTKKKN